MRGWNSKFFSLGSREVLIKAVLQAIPSHAMSCFRIPTSISNRIEQLCVKFWWVQDSDKRGMHWTRWDALCQPKSKGGMGFRNLTAFNKALLAKQVWHIIQEPNSLMARVLKGKYFKSTDIMQVALGSKPSFVWRSLFWSRDLLQQRLCWRVGSGQSILAHADPWIPGLPKFRCLGSIDSHNMSLPVTVDSYILPSGSWNEGEVRQAFLPVEAEAILNIPLNRRGGADTRYWIGGKAGKYSVRSGYYIHLGAAAPPPFQSMQSFNRWWQVLWHLKIPPKVRIFLWRASRNFIPTPVNLKAHHVPSNGLCAMCRVDYATTSHSLLFCGAVRKVWKNAHLWNNLKKFLGDPFIDIICILSKELAQDKLELFGILCWAVWTEICKRNHNEVALIKEINVDWACALLFSFRFMELSCSISEVLPRSMDEKWKVPAPNTFRLDVDAGFNENAQRFSIGAVIRDGLGSVRGALARVIRHPGSVLGAEIHAIREEIDLGPLGVLVMEIRELLATGSFLSLQHMRRSANRVAHCLACF